MDKTIRSIWRSEDHQKLVVLPSTIDLLDLTVCRVKSFEFPSTLSNSRYPPDGIKWCTEKDKGRPQYRDVIVDGTMLKVVRCTSSSNSGLKKKVIRSDTKYVALYSLEFGDIDTSENYIQRLSGDDRENIREMLKDKVNICKGIEHIREAGFTYSESQIRNQSRNVDLGKCASGRRKITNPESLTQLQHLRSETSNYNQSPAVNGKSVIRFMDCNPSAIKMFRALCPSKEKIRDQINSAEKLKKMTSIQRSEVFNNFLSTNTDGVLFKSRLLLDSTFELCDGYLTLLIGEFGADFKTVNKKSVFNILAWMLHQSKEITHHEAFAEFVASRFGNIDLPCLIVDGEESFKVYSEKLHVPIIRCDIHIADNMKRKLGKKIGAETETLLMGKMVGSTYISGLLNSSTLSSFQNKLKLSLQKASIKPSAFEWVTKRCEMLFDHCSTAHKFACGIICYRSTTNQIENTNMLLKKLITKRTTIDDVAKVCLQMSSDTMNLLYRSIRFNDGKIKSNRFDELCSMSDVDLNEYMRRIGMSPSKMRSWEYPRGLEMCLKFDQMVTIEKEAEGLKVVVAADFYVTVDAKKSNENAEKHVNVVRGKHDELCCHTCGSFLPLRLCVHIVSVLQSMGEPDRWMELSKLEKAMRDTTMNKVAKMVTNSNAGEKFQRKGSENSHRNQIRKINNVLPADKSFNLTLSDVLSEISGRLDDSEVGANEISDLFDDSQIGQISTFATTDDVLYINNDNHDFDAEDRNEIETGEIVLDPLENQSVQNEMSSDSIEVETPIKRIENALRDVLENFDRSEIDHIHHLNRRTITRVISDHQKVKQTVDMIIRGAPTCGDCGATNFEMQVFGPRRYYCFECTEYYPEAVRKECKIDSLKLSRAIETINTNTFKCNTVFQPNDGTRTSVRLSKRKRLSYDSLGPYTIDDNGSKIYKKN